MPRSILPERMLLRSKRLLKYSLRVLVLVLLTWALSFFLIPVPSFDEPYSTVVESNEGELLSARIARDGQWRFPEMDSVPSRFETCLLHFEDRNFYHHPGVDVKGMMRAMKANWEAGRVVQGGSTLSMQLARMLSKGNARTFWNKLKETLMALHLEVNLSKQEILNAYVSHAPFGGNVVGLETAAWRYYGRDPWDLSWSECATLAVLPNAPSLIYPGKGQERLLEKRNRLLSALKEEGKIDEEEYALALLEPLPQRPAPMPDLASHYLLAQGQKAIGQRIHSTLDGELQRKVRQRLNAHVQRLSSIEVYNGAVILMDTKSQEIIAYVGNADYTKEHANAVDCASAPRSSGSILKPLLYAAMIDAGELSPQQLLPDIPSQFAEYSPENYYGRYDGAVPADQALTRSLNIPFVHLLKDYGVARFYKDLRSLGLSSVDRSADSYGLSLMLGGAEVRLDELTRCYAELGSTLLESEEESRISPWAIHHTFEALTALTRPEGREYQRTFDSHQPIAWKTGTSFGNKDAWAIGVTPTYTIGVWVGNADGEGRSGLTGVSSAAPLLFDVLDLVEVEKWFTMPAATPHQVDLCAVSGQLKGAACELSVMRSLPAPDYSSIGTCRYHHQLYVTADGRFRGDHSCAGSHPLHPESWFVLPPLQEAYYRPLHPDYRSLPALLPGCMVSGQQMEFEYPFRDQQIYIPIDLDGRPSRIICRLAHRDVHAEVYWYVDQEYLGATRDIHEMPVLIGIGSHELLAVDQEGEEIRSRFEVLSDR
jgi:penicillin-binding protein 1C